MPPHWLSVMFKALTVVPRTLNRRYLTKTKKTNLHWKIKGEDSFFRKWFWHFNGQAWKRSSFLRRGEEKFPEWEKHRNSPFHLGRAPIFKEKNRAWANSGDLCLYCKTSGEQSYSSTKEEKSSHLSIDTFTFMEWFSSGNLTRSLKIDTYKKKPLRAGKYQDLMLPYQLKDCWKLHYDHVMHVLFMQIYAYKRTHTKIKDPDK